MVKCDAADWVCLQLNQNRKVRWSLWCFIVCSKKTNKQKNPCLIKTEDSFQSGYTLMGPRTRSDVAPLFFKASSILSDVCMSEFGKGFREEEAGHHQQKPLCLLHQGCSWHGWSHRRSGLKKVPWEKKNCRWMFVILIPKPCIPTWISQVALPWLRLPVIFEGRVWRTVIGGTG